mmetsp:Transcript_9400/g.15135  ORF Transcript_9400/g.15135 Transcript_9400/m.15135 type:complete len:113 (+) Transcript_9400:54-392(+)
MANLHVAQWKLFDDQWQIYCDVTEFRWIRKRDCGMYKKYVRMRLIMKQKRDERVLTFFRDDVQEPSIDCGHMVVVAFFFVILNRLHANNKNIQKRASRKQSQTFTIRSRSLP